MNRDDLLGMLDLGARSKPAARGKAEPDDGLVIAPAAAGGAAGPAAGAAASENALEVDEWGMRRGRDLADGNERVMRAVAGDAAAAADFFAAGFDPDPRPTPACTDPARHQFVKQLLETPEYRALHASTMLDDAASEIAAVHFAEQCAALKKERDKGKPAPGGKGRPDRGGGGARSGGKPDGMAEEMATLRAVGRALAEAAKDVEECKEAAAACGMGAGGAGEHDPRRVAELYKRVRNNPTLRRICELAGRYRRVAQSKQRMKSTHGWDDLVGVEPAGEVARLLPHELAKLAVPELELDTLRRLAERQTLCREYRSVEPAGKGPVIVAVDESGSMSGNKGHTAKALALAMAWVARQQRRWCSLVAYSGDSGERLLALPPGRWDDAALTDWLVGFIGGGSDIDVPVREMPRMYAQLKAPPGVTDLVFLTDAICRLPAEVRDRFLAWKKAARCRLVTLVVRPADRDRPAGDIALISDEVHFVPSLDASEEAVGRVLSI